MKFIIVKLSNNTVARINIANIQYFYGEECCTLVFGPDHYLLTQATSQEVMEAIAKADEINS